MRAVRFVDGQVTLADVPRPEDAPGAVRVRVRTAGICGSDLAMLAAGFPMQGTPGHEVSGELEDGTPVAIEPVVPCGACSYCRAGNYQVCRSGTEMIFGVGRHGGMAEEMVVPARCLVALPRSVDVSIACLVEPLAVAVHGLRRARATADLRVAVIGGGTIGLCAVAAAAAIGCEVSLAARHPAQRNAGTKLGAGELSGEYDLAIDCAGSASATASACEALRPNGRLLLLAASFDSIELPGLVVAAREIEIVSSTMYGVSATGRDIDAAAALLGARPEIGEFLITHRFSLEEAVRGFETATLRANGALKVALEP